MERLIAWMEAHLAPSHAINRSTTKIVLTLITIQEERKSMQLALLLYCNEGYLSVLYQSVVVNPGYVTVFLTTPLGGGGNGAIGFPFSARRMLSCQMGAAPSTPVTS